MIASARNAVDYGDPNTKVNPRSEFAIVATENNTQVTFTLTAASYSNNFQSGIPYNIRLNKGQVFLMAACDTGVRDPSNTSQFLPWTSGPDCDLTGSYISSDKPIAVFSGHERAVVPESLGYHFPPWTRDGLAEQMLPISTWGRHFIATGSGSDARRLPGGDLVRIVASVDNSHILVNGSAVATLRGGQHLDVMSGGVSVIDCDQPILVARLMQSSDIYGSGIGDPDLTILRPVDHYAKRYTLPGWDDEQDPGTADPIFAEPHLLVICDASTTTTTLRNGAPLSGPWTPIPRTNFVYGIYDCTAQEQRIESPLPCYAESFAFGFQDSYTFAGGGDYAYVDSLFAQDLDFKSIPIDSSKQLQSDLHTSITPLATDTVLVYGYEWVSGDTSYFSLPTGTTFPYAIAPNHLLQVPIVFRPTAARPYSAKLRVWSSAVNPVFINVRGGSAVPCIKVQPMTIDFGRVRLGGWGDSSYIILDTGSADLNLTDVDYSRSVISPDFRVTDPGPANLPIRLTPGGGAVIVPVHFQPTKEGTQIEHIPIYSDDPVRGLTNPPVVTLMGNGVKPHVYSSGYDFGTLRVLDSASHLVSIVNRGTDSTGIDSVTIVDSSSIADWQVSLDSLPPAGNHSVPVTLEYKGPDTIRTFTVKFHPQSLGEKTLVIRIHTTDGEVLFDGFSGTAVEPLVVVAPKLIDFDTIIVARSGTPPVSIDSLFTVSNLGTMPGLLQAVTSTDASHFRVGLNKLTRPLPASLDTQAQVIDTATFLPFESGDFVDTLYVSNDTRYRFYPQRLGDTIPMVILKASVRTGAIDIDSVNFGTITTCDTSTKYVTIHNPYPVTIRFDTAIFLANGGGFSIPHTFLFPIYIAGDSTFNLPITYAFPPDSLNGTQRAVLGLYQRRGEGETPIIDTLFADVIRKQRVFTLHAHLPQYASSANDVNALKLPITVEGPRAGVTELNSWTLSLHFSNDLFEPIGIDTTGALAVRGDSTFTFTTHWDQATRTFTIIVTGSSVSDPTKITNNLLLNILMRAFLTTDTSVTVTPTFTWAVHPCAYNLQSFTLDIPYADECGDPTMRAVMLGKTPSFHITNVWPNPLENDGRGVSLVYDAAEPVHSTTRVFREDGEQVWVQIGDLPKGSGAIVLGRDILPESGPAFIRVETTTPAGLRQVQTVKISQIR